MNTGESTSAPIGAIALVDPAGVLRYGRNETVQVYAASLIKIPVAIAVLRQVDDGLLSLDDLLPVSSTFTSPVDGSSFTVADDSLDPVLTAADGGEVSLEQLVWRSIIVSSNEATNLLLDVVGFKAVTKVLRDICGTGTSSKVQRHVFDVVARDAGRDNTMSAGDAALLMHAVRFGSPASPESMAFLRRACLAQEQRDLIAAGTPSGAVIGNKEGETDLVRHDMAFVDVDNRNYLLAVLTSGMSEIAVSFIRAAAMRAYQYVVDDRFEDAGWP